MKVIEVYGKLGCGKCVKTRDKVRFYLSKHGIPDVQMIFYDLETPDGLAEFRFNDLNDSDLSAVIFRKEDKEVARFLTPTTEQIRQGIELLTS